MPALDRALLEASATDVRDGVESRAFHLEVGGERLFAMLTQPEGGPRSDLGFVVAHSFGLEVLTLRRAERGVSRALAAAGHPVLYVHRRGFGDSEGDVVDATVERQLEDLRAAAAWLRAAAGSTRIGAIGCKLGGLFAGLLAREGEAERLALFQPAVSGKHYCRSFLREMQLVRMAYPDGSDRRSVDQMLADMRRDGVLDVLGYALPSRLFEDLSAIDLRETPPTADTLLVQVAKRNGLSRELGAFRDAVIGAGGRCRVEQVREPAGSQFGSASFVATTKDVNVRTDVMEPVVEGLGALTTSWVTS